MKAITLELAFGAAVGAALQVDQQTAIVALSIDRRRHGTGFEIEMPKTDKK